MKLKNLLKNLLIIGTLMLLLAAAVISAAKPEAASEAASNDATATTEKKQTFGLCVSEAAARKNACYGEIKELRENCLNASPSKDSTRECKLNYKHQKKQCKK